MSIEQLKDSIQDFAKDIRLNLSTVLTEEGAEGLSKRQIFLVALSCAYATKEEQLISALTFSSKEILTPEDSEGAKSAAVIMAMNNVYYRTTHLLENKELSQLPAKLRMNVIGKPTVAKKDFELMSFAVSSLSGCAACVSSHYSELIKSGFTPVGIQAALRIAAVMQATAQALCIQKK